MTISTVNPATDETVHTYPLMEAPKVRAAVQATHAAFLRWRRVPMSDRASHLRGAAKLLRERAAEFARLMAVEMGKPVTAGRAEVEKCAWVCDYFADRTEEFLRPEPVATDATRSFVTFQPLGVVLAVMPWNFPFWQVFRFAAPALMAGNAALLKHASNTVGCALAIEEIFKAAGFPADLFRTLVIDSSRVRTVIANRHVAAVTLTGSVEAGRAIAQTAGRQLKKTVLELGGSDAYLVLEDADLAQAAATCATSRLINSGQSCIAAKRFIVVEPVRAEFERLLVDAMRAAKMGDPLDETTTLGPLARRDLRDDLHAQVEGSLRKGARCLLGGTMPEGKGAFYPPTVLTEVRKGMPAFDEELFGPVAAIVPVRDEAAAIAAANDSAFGLGAAVFTGNVEHGTRIAAEEIAAGSCFVNELVKSDPRLPFGGIKHSGYGRELSHYGLKEFVNVKTIFVK
ncbi:MAG TPA: NAD-dependent succinate-semialdehyde dehydrogenase [Opitutaceae bacterium]